MRVALVDDHPLVSEGLGAVLALEEGIEVIWQASTGQEALQLFSQSVPDITIVDLRLPDANGLDIIKTIKEQGSCCRFIVLTSSANSEDFIKAGEIGVEGYVSKEALPEEFLSAVRLVSRGRKYFDPALVEIIIHGHQDDCIAELTQRELEVLKALGEGLNNRQIAKKLFISENTVKKHVSQILDKLCLDDRTQAALYALKKGLVEFD